MLDKIYKQLCGFSYFYYVFPNISCQAVNLTFTSCVQQYSSKIIAIVTSGHLCSPKSLGLEDISQTTNKDTTKTTNNIHWEE